MAARTGTQLVSTDMAAVDSALATLVGAPTGATATLESAVDTVIANARDSRGITETAVSGGRRPVYDVEVMARAIKREIATIKSKSSASTMTWRRLQKQLEGAPGWGAVKTRGYTT